MVSKSIMRVSLLLLLGARLSLALPRLNTRQTTDVTLLGSPIYNSGWYHSYLVPFSKNAIPSIYGATYTTFFSNNTGYTDVKTTFQAIIERSGDNPAGTPIHKPNIICLNEGVNELQKALNVCNLPAKPTSYTRNPLGSTVGVNSDVYLCPSFFDLPQTYGEKENCPTVSATEPNKFQDHNDMVQTQAATMIHLLSHLYAAFPIPYDKETYPLNELIALGPNNMVANPNNYAYYNALLHGHCDSLPTYPPTGNLRKRQTADATVPLIPAVLDDYVYDIGFDANKLQANLTALGH